MEQFVLYKEKWKCISQCPCLRKQVKLLSFIPRVRYEWISSQRTKKPKMILTAMLHNNSITKDLYEQGKKKPTTLVLLKSFFLQVYFLCTILSHFIIKVILIPGKTQ